MHVQTLINNSLRPRARAPTQNVTSGREELTYFSCFLCRLETAF